MEGAKPPGKLTKAQQVLLMERMSYIQMRAERRRWRVPSWLIAAFFLACAAGIWWVAQLRNP